MQVDVQFNDEVDRVVWNTDIGYVYNQKTENRTKKITANV